MSILEDLQRALADQADKVPAKWRTMQQIATQERKSTTWAKRAMRKLLDAGTWEEKSFRLMTSNGLRDVPHYARKPQ